MKFNLITDFIPTGDQPSAIQSLTDGIKSKHKHQTLLGVTGSGKTFTIANVISTLNKPTLILAHNKTLAAQLYSEFKGFFPIILLSILFHIMTIINLKHIFLQQVFTLKKICQ